MGDARITLRITDVELDEIDDFLARHPEYHNRSQLMRQAIMEYIKMVDRGDFRNRGVTVELDERIRMILEEYVDFRYFKNLDDLMNFVMRTLVREGILANILKGYVSGLNGLRLDEEARMREERNLVRR